MKLRPNDPLTRFLTTKKHLNAEERSVRHHAFLPRPSSLEVSVFQTRGLSETRIWTLAEKNIRVRKLFGRADITVVHVQDVGLRVDPDHHPSRHANIIGWPTEKDHQIELAIVLAIKARLHFSPTKTSDPSLP